MSLLQISNYIGGQSFNFAYIRLLQLCYLIWIRSRCYREIAVTLSNREIQFEKEED